MNLKKGDKVIVRRGKDRGKSGTIMHVFPSKGRILVEGIAMVQKHVRPKRTGEKGQLTHVASTIPAANVMIMCPNCKRGVRIGRSQQDGKNQRICKTCQTPL